MSLPVVLVFLLGLVLIVIESVLLIKRNKESDLIYRLIPIWGFGIKKAKSDLLFPVLFLLIFIIDFKPSMFSYAVLTCYITYSILIFMGAFISIDLRNRGIFTKFRFIPWNDVISISLVKKMYKEKVVCRNYVLKLSNRRLTKKLIINTDLYDNSGGIIGETLSARGFQINVLTEEDLKK